MRGSEFSEFTAFMAIVREGSFRSAARRLGLSPSALSHTIRGLEERLGIRLLNRTTRSVAPTEAGRALFARLGPAIAEMEGAVDGLGAFRGRPAGTVRLNLPRLAAATMIGPHLARFAEAFPDIRLELVVDDAFADIVAGGFDAGIRLGERVERDMIAVRLTGDLRLAVVAAPDYFAGRSPPATPHDLVHHACLSYRWSHSGQLHRWRFDGTDGPVEVDVRGPFTANDTGLLIDAALAGVGVACLPESALAAPIADGRLVRVLDAWCRPFPGFFLYHPGRRQLPPALRAFIDFFRRATAAAG